MRVVVFGAAGFVGRNVVQRLKDEAIEFIATDVVDSPFNSGFNYVKADMQNHEDISGVVKDGDSILHLAASPLLVSIQNPRQNMQINIGGTLSILDAAREHHASKVVFTSASSIVGEVRYNPVDEAHPCTPKTPYAVAKKACEDYLRVYSEMFGLNYLVFRFFNVYGPWQLPQSGALIPRVYSTLTTEAPFTIFGDGSTSRDFIYVDDVVDFLLAALRTDAKNEVVNLGTGKPTTILDLVKSSSALLDVDPKLVYQPKRPGEIENFVADVSKLERIFHRLPATGLEEGLRRTFAWLRETGA